jgi:hypothetical protein
MAVRRHREQNNLSLCGMSARLVDGAMRRRAPPRHYRQRQTVAHLMSISIDPCCRPRSLRLVAPVLSSVSPVSTAILIGTSCRRSVILRAVTTISSKFVPFESTFAEDRACAADASAAVAGSARSSCRFRGAPTIKTQYAARLERNVIRLGSGDPI